MDILSSLFNGEYADSNIFDLIGSFNQEKLLLIKEGKLIFPNKKTYHLGNVYSSNSKYIISPTISFEADIIFVYDKESLQKMESRHLIRKVYRRQVYENKLFLRGDKLYLMVISRSGGAIRLQMEIYDLSGEELRMRCKSMPEKIDLGTDSMTYLHFFSTNIGSFVIGKTKVVKFSDDFVISVVPIDLSETERYLTFYENDIYTLDGQVIYKISLIDGRKNAVFSLDQRMSSIYWNSHHSQFGNITKLIVRQDRLFVLSSDNYLVIYNTQNQQIESPNIIVRNFTVSESGDKYAIIDNNGKVYENTSDQPLPFDGIEEVLYSDFSLNVN